MKFPFKVFVSTIGLSIGLFISASASASGGGGGFSTGGGTSQRVDPQYELGKSYYKASQTSAAKLEYCVKVDDKLKKLSRSSVKKFKRGSVDEFVNALYNCAEPNQRIADVIADEQGSAILYYLNKRFKLRLTNS